VEAGVLVAGTNGIVINAAAGDRVILEGLDIEGLGTGLNGVQILAGGMVEIIRCSIRRFTGNGVNLVSSTASARAIIKDSFIAFNNGGVNVQGNGVGNIGSILSTQIDANTSFAVQANGVGNIVAAANSVLNASPTAISLLNGATAVSFGPSNVVSGAGNFTATNPFK
ncbi:MAG: hypothetical protein ACRED5_04230, partial [Propylenella sp.]